MAITSVQTLLPTTVSPEKGRAGKLGAGSSAFNTLLSSLGTPQADSTPEPQLAAAELLRMEMMQNSLALFGAAEADRPSGLQGMESLLSCLAGKNAAVAGSRSGRAGGGASLHPEQVGAGGPAAGADQIEGIGRTAAQFIGTPYRFGGEGAEGIDCSSFVQQVFQEHHIALPRTAREQIKMGREVAPGELKQGDLVFFQTYASYPSHVGIYLGEGKMIHASSGKGEVTVSDLNSDYYRSRFVGAKRVA